MQSGSSHTPSAPHVRYRQISRLISSTQFQVFHETFSQLEPLAYLEGAGDMSSRPTTRLFSLYEVWRPFDANGGSVHLINYYEVYTKRTRVSVAVLKQPKKLMNKTPSPVCVETYSKYNTLVLAAEKDAPEGSVAELKRHLPVCPPWVTESRNRAVSGV